MRPVLLLLLLTAVTLWLALAARVAAQQADLVTFAQAYNAAWNAHDLDAVLRFFAPGAIVRHRGEDVPEAVWNAQEDAVRQTYLDDTEGATPKPPQDYDRPRTANWCTERRTRPRGARP